MSTILTPGPSWPCLHTGSHCTWFRSFVRDFELGWVTKFGLPRTLHMVFNEDLSHCLPRANRMVSPEPGYLASRHTRGP